MSTVSVVINGQAYSPAEVLATDAVTLSELLQQTRKGRKLSLQEAATQLGITKSYLWELEKGLNTNPTKKILQKLATFYGIPANTLLFSE